jgi:hypothetical protein
VPWLHLVWMAFVWLALAMLMFDWRAGFVLMCGVAINFIGILALIPPYYRGNQAIGYAVVGVILGAIVCTGRNHRDVRRLPLMLSLEQTILTFTQVMWRDVPALAWMFGLRIVGLPLTMFAVIALAQRLQARRSSASPS